MFCGRHESRERESGKGGCVKYNCVNPRGKKGGERGERGESGEEDQISDPS